jgi:hypothetical protein
MTTPVQYFGKLLCLSLFVVPSPLVEAKKSNPLELLSFYATNNAEAAASNKTAAAKAAKAKATATRFAAAQRAAARKAELKLISMEANIMFEEMQLADSGLNEKVLEYALIGYHRLLKKHALRNSDILSICDFSQSSSLKRMYVIDMRTRKLLYRNYVAHGISSGEEFANSFSNAPESHKSSLGFYVTRSTYFGENGLSLRIDGLDRGFNSLASERNIVIHGAPYVSERILHKYGVMGTTFGCPAIPQELTSQLIPLLKDGSCFFIYYPSPKYLSHSSILNG